ncbi:MAG: ABC transporter ATP-binding protein [Dehalococcoidales bacterium]|nr:MAG: ABC transporter ATP-binding protein [Dehalococcoidales bacterium]
MKTISCQGLTKHYGKVIGLDNLDLDIEEGTIFGFLGPNGAGKTTTLKMLTGLSRPTSGRAWVAGEEITLYSLSLKNKIGYLPEEPAFYNWMTGREYLTFVGELFRLPTNEIRTRCDELLEMVDLTQAESRRVGGYSRGMRQRLGIAQALMNKPRVLFLDEPSSALDPIGRLEILKTITRLKTQATTVFLSSHILADVERVCDVVGIIDEGRLIVESEIDDLREHFALSLFELEFEENAFPFIKILEGLPWVEKVVLEEDEDTSKFTIRASDMTRGKRELPKLIAESGLTLRQYQLVMPTLEEVFIELLGKKEE